MKIAISGAQCVGKTTLMKCLEDDVHFNYFLFKGNVARGIQETTGNPINENGTNVTQILIASKFVEHFAHENCISDRSILDCMAYTHILYMDNKISKDTLDFVYHLFKFMIYKYDILYYIPPEFEIIQDGIRSNSKEFQDKTHTVMLQYLKDFKVPYIELSGSVEERVNTIKESMAQYRKYNGTKQEIIN